MFLEHMVSEILGFCSILENKEFPNVKKEKEFATPGPVKAKTKT